MRASTCRERASLVSRWRFVRCDATARKTASPLAPFRYSLAYCHEIRACRRCLNRGHAGRSGRERSSSGTSSSVCESAIGTHVRSAVSE
eukprot:4790290-Prymnesium_polylepis.2